MTPASALFRYYGSLLFSKSAALSGMRLASSGQNTVRFEPYFSESSRVIIPVSFSRYVVKDDLSTKRAAEYDDFLAAIFNRTAYLLRSGLICSVDVLATGDLQKINWPSTLVEKVEQHFFATHASSLSSQSKCYKWDEWIAKKGKAVFEERYKNIVSQSLEGSNWYDLMLRTQNSLKISTSIDQSLEYQRREYAAITLMDEYTHLVYAGPMSIAWMYLYHEYSNLPIFSQARLDKLQDKSIESNDAKEITQMVLSNIKRILTSPNFPPDSKKEFIDMGMGLFYTYGHDGAFLNQKKNKNDNNAASGLFSPLNPDKK